jgi:hypothetical protein
MLNQVVALSGQVISFTSNAPLSAAVGAAGYDVTATGGGSGNPIVLTIYASASGVCSISGSTVTFTGAGVCVIDANQAGNASYSAAMQAQQSFVVAAAPAAVTTAASGIGATTADLNGSVTANGAASTVSFDYGTTVAYGNNGAATPATIAASGGGAVTLAIMGLVCNTTYHFRVKGVNFAGTGIGTDLGFTTLACQGNVPDAPTAVSALAGPNCARISFGLPATDGGSPITAYTASCTAAGQPTKSASGAVSPLIVSGLQSGVGYACSVAATNGVGIGASSVAVMVVPSRGDTLTPVLMLLLFD